MSAQELFIVFAIPIVLGVIFAFSFTVEPRRLINGVLFNFFAVTFLHYFDRCFALCVAFILVVVECHSGLAA